MFGLIVWVAVAHGSGSGWVQTVGAVIAGFLLTGLVAPAFAVSRARAEITGDGPGDGVAGMPVSVEVLTNRPVRLLSVEPPGPPTLTGPSHGHRSRLRTVPGRHRSAPPAGTNVSTGPVASRVTFVPGHRGVLASIVVEVASAAPFGLLWWTKRVVLPLPRPLHVAPRIGPDTTIGSRDDDRAGDAPRQVPTTATGTLRGVRTYRTGDLRHTVHWPATAHTGKLMVRETEEPTSEPITVTVDLPFDPDLAERRAEEALGTITGLLAKGRLVLLATIETTGPRHAPVTDQVDAGRRLARAVSSLPPAPPPPPPPAAWSAFSSGSAIR